MHKAPKLGPIGKGFVQEIKTQKGSRFVARWNAYVEESGERRRITCGPHELGPKVSHGPGLKTIKDAQREWDKIYWSVFTEHHPAVASVKPSNNAIPVTASMRVTDFITNVYEPARKDGWEDNSRINWEYYRDNFLTPFFGEMSLDQMNDTETVKRFMGEIGDRKFSDWTAKKAFSYTKSILDMSRDMGVTKGNASRLIPKNRRLPKGVKKATSQPAITVEQFAAILNEIQKGRDKIILKLLFFCALRRSELLCLKWQDFYEQEGMHVLKIERTFCSRTHKVKEWTKDQLQEQRVGKVAVPPGLATELEGWRKYGDTKGNDPNSYIFPTRNGTCLIPTNWAEDVLKPAGTTVGIPDVSYHWFRRGHATIQHHKKEADKPIQGQLRHSKAETTRNIYMQQISPEVWNAVVNLEASVEAKRAK